MFNFSWPCTRIRDDKINKNIGLHPEEGPQQTKPVLPILNSRPEDLDLFPPQGQVLP